MSEHDSNEPNVVVERSSGGGVGLFLLGLAVGAGIALLFAPQSGAETRADLRRGARRARRKARDFAEEAREAAHDIVRTSRGAAGDFVRTTRTAARDAAGEAKEALERRLARHGRGADVEESEDIGV
jgi:gas vesicle protein